MPDQTGFFKYIKDVITGSIFTVDETAALSSKAPKTDTVKGDGTAGRVIRAIRVVIQNATEAAHLKAGTLDIWNGDVNGDQDNIGKDGVLTGIWTLNASGATLLLSATGVSGNCLGVLAVNPGLNRSNVSFNVRGQVSADGMAFLFEDNLGNDVDLTTAVDAGLIMLDVTYITSA